MNDFSPKPEHKFTFGLRTVGNIGCDPFELKDIFALIQKAGLGEIKQVRASGGGMKSSLWQQIPASVLDAELITVNAYRRRGVCCCIARRHWSSGME